MSELYDFVIVGGGPGGGFCAYKLSKAGFRVALLESAPEIKRKVCGEYLSPFGVDILKKEGLVNLVEMFPKLFGMKIVSMDNEVLNTQFPVKEGKINFGVSLNRKNFDNELLSLVEKFGGSVFKGHRASTVLKEEYGWKITCHNQKNFKCRVLIGADGRNSFVAKALGMKDFVDTTKVALHCHIYSNKKNDRLGEMHLFKDGSYIGIDPVGERETNISLVCKSYLLRSKVNKRELLNSYIRQSPEILKSYGEVPEDIKVNSVAPITNKMKEFTGKNIALIGDAAGFLDPLTGEGMSNALWMADILSNELIKNRSNSLFKFQPAINSYEKKKKVFFKQKTILNILFQIIIKRRYLVKILSNFLKTKELRGDILVGMIGNIYSPFEGLLKLLKI